MSDTNNMEMVILWRLAKKLDAPLKRDDGFKFKAVDNMLLFMDIANRFNTVEVSEDWFLMSVLITAKPSVLLSKTAQKSDTKILDVRDVWKDE